MSPKPQSLQVPADALHDDADAGDPRLWLSALVDGEAHAAPRGCELWRGDAEARRSWHTYHLIGDVLRSEELARSPARDAAFLVTLRQRLAQEPVVLAPSAPLGTAPRSQRWLVPVAAAAGFVAVAGVLVLVRMNNSTGPSGWQSMASASQPGVTLVSTDTGAVQQAPAAAGLLIRDARLDEFLRAHQAARGGVAVAAPGGTLRRMEVVVPVGAER